jgi:hypothetical protein
VRDQKALEVFFLKDKANHPGGIATDPNWFYYWQDGSVCGIDTLCVYDATASYGFTKPGVDNIMRLGHLAAAENNGPETFTKADGSTLTTTGSGQGVQCVAETIQHERNHLTIYTTFGLSILTATPGDPDADAIPSADEPTFQGISTDGGNPDTFNMAARYPNYATYGDNEIRCRYLELHLTIPIHPELDWANPGCNSKTQHGPAPLQ